VNPKSDRIGHTSISISAGCFLRAECAAHATSATNGERSTTDTVTRLATTTLNSCLVQGPVEYPESALEAAGI
jgi:hypothetical protein